MIRSMTGFGRGQAESAHGTCAVEARSVNGRFLKVQVRAGPLLSARESDIESLVRQSVRRGSVTVHLALTPHEGGGLVTIDEGLVRAYQTEFRKLGLDEACIPTLPGVLMQKTQELRPEHWSLCTKAIAQALAEMDQRRAAEGERLGVVLVSAVAHMESLLQKVRMRAEGATALFRQRLTERLAVLLPEGGEPGAMEREVVLFAERTNVAEELDRLDSHIAQARGLIRNEAAVGRTLDFLAQEMFREVNTLGAKCADLEIGGAVVQLKTIVDSLREQVANIE